MAGRPAKLDWSPYPQTPAGRFDRARVKEIYDKDDLVEWIPFCLKHNWPPEALRHKVGSGAWVADKKRRIEEKIAAEVAQLSVDHKTAFIKDLRQTLAQYPLAVDNALVLIGQWMKQFTEPGAKPAKAGDIYAISAAVKTCIEAKKSVFGISETLAKIEAGLPPPEALDTEWVVKLKGQKDVTPRQLTELMLQYLDQPISTQSVSNEEEKPEVDPEVDDGEVRHQEPL